MLKHKPVTSNQTVLVAIINRKKDLDILLSEKWYRIPVVRMSKRPFDWLAFYQTSALGKEGKLIRYYARVGRSEELLRRRLLPDEVKHLRADEKYNKFIFSDVRELRRPIVNNTSMRFTFGFTTLPRLLRFRTLPSLFGVRPLEMIFRRLLKKRDLPFIPEYPIKSRRRVRYRLDLAIFCKTGQIDIECDQHQYHCGRRRLYDRRRDRFLRRRGWTVLRFSEEDILSNAGECLEVVGEIIKELGGIV